VALGLLLEVRRVSLELFNLQPHLVGCPALAHKYAFQVLVSRDLKLILGMECFIVIPDVSQLLLERVLIVFGARNGALQFRLVGLLVRVEALERVKLVEELVAFRCALVVVLV
jgi:hypothetical protein